MLAAPSIPASLAATTPPQLSTTEQSHLTTLASSGFDLALLSRSLQLAPADLATFASSPAVQSHLDALLTLAQKLLTLRAIEARRAAIDELETVARSATDLIEKRRAATQLLRATSAPLVSPFRSAPTSDIRHPTSDIAPPRPVARPHPNYSPSQVANLVTHALRAADEPDESSGAATLAVFLAPGATIDNTPLPVPSGPSPAEIPDPTDSPELLEAIEDHAAISTLPNCTKHYVTTKASVTGDNAVIPVGIEHNGALSFLTFHLSRRPNSLRPNCWLITAIVTTDTREKFNTG